MYAKNGCFAFYRFDPCLRLAKKDIGAVAVRSLEFAVMENRGIEILVAGRIAATAGIRLPDAAGAVDEHFVEAALVGPTIGLVAQVPFAENSRRVAGRFEHLGQGGRLQCQSFAFIDGVSNAVFEFVPPGHQGRPSRCTRRTHMKIGESDALARQGVDRRRTNNWIAVTRKVAVPDVVGHYDDDIGCVWRSYRHGSQSQAANPNDGDEQRNRDH